MIMNKSENEKNKKMTAKHKQVKSSKWLNVKPVVFGKYYFFVFFRLILL